MSKVKGLESAKELQAAAVQLKQEVVDSIAKAQAFEGRLKQLELTLVQREAHAAREAAEKAREEAEAAMAALASEKAAAKPAGLPEQADAPAESVKSADDASDADAQEVAKAEPRTALKPEINQTFSPDDLSPGEIAAQRDNPKGRERQPASRQGTTGQSGVRPPAARRPEVPSGRDFLKANRPPMPKTPIARPPQPAGQQGARPPQQSGGAARPYAGQQRPYGAGQQRPYGAGQQTGAPGQRPQQGGQTGGAARPAGRPPFGAKPKAPELLPVAEKERVSNYDPNKSAYQRVYDVEKKSPKAKRQLFKETVAGSGGVEDERIRKQRGKKAQALKPKQEPIRIERAVMTTEVITVKDLTEKLGKPAGEIIKRLMLIGIMATINKELDFDTANLVAQEFGIELEHRLSKTYEDALNEETDRDDEDGQVSRPPVVTIMGHVDHGKTSLLDKIRSTNVVKTEAGGITQHIGAYTVVKQDRKITFLDTPGHEAFTAMRARGAQATDIAILVVSAIDGVMPQTIEAINHAKAAGVPIIVAVNMMDREGANPDRVMQQLMEHELVPEEWGGETVVAKVSAKTGEGIDDLLENILFVADLKELTANPDRAAKGVVVEAKLDKGRGPVATVLVQTGTLHIGDMIVAGTVYGKVRAMIDDKGAGVDEAGPSTPVEVIGFNDVPSAGDILNAVDSERLSRMVAQERRDKIKAEQVKSMSKVSLDDLFTQISEGSVKELNVIIKADVQGSVEAVRQSLEKLGTEEVRVKSIHGGVGAINETDVLFASTSNAIIVGFNVRPDALAKAAAEREGVDLRLYRVIYDAIEDIQSAIKGMLTPKFKENILGHAQVRQVFRVTGAGTIAGCYITDGMVRRNAHVRLLRDNIVIFEGRLSSLKRFKDDAREVATGYECGIGLEGYNDIKENDVIECFVQERIEA